jgi:hypothetical protein
MIKFQEEVQYSQLNFARLLPAPNPSGLLTNAHVAREAFLRRGDCALIAAFTGYETLSPEQNTEYC